MKRYVTCCNSCGKELEGKQIKESKAWDLGEFRHMRKRHHCSKKCRMKSLTTFELANKPKKEDEPTQEEQQEQEEELPTMGF